MIESKKRYCLAFNTMVEEDCKNEKCPLAPCSLNSVIKEISKVFKKKGFSNKNAIKMSRNFVLPTFQNKGEINGYTDTNIDKVEVVG